MPTVQQIINIILRDVPGAPFADTVDVIKAGDPNQDVTGIVTTFLATHAVLQKAVDLGANFVITHEPVFYNHLDETGWLDQDPVYCAKRKFIDDHHLTIWRFHDYWHSVAGDGITLGVLRDLGWASYADTPYSLTIPVMPLSDLVRHLKSRLGIQFVRVVGSPDMPCQRIALQVGAPGGTSHITALRGEFDTLITGEIHEWETCEYVRDTIAQNHQKALVILGHERSEESGMAYLVEWLAARAPGIPITHVPSGDPFRFE